MPQGELQDYSVESVASSLVLILGGIGAVLTILLSSRCACRVRVGLSDQCYIFDCSRTPPPDPIEEAEEIIKKEDIIIKKEDIILENQTDKGLKELEKNEILKETIMLLPDEADIESPKDPKKITGENLQSE
tara:strand:+ start:778 stop:1173 length:396 start_codon:yes stop_codon:yes gene_type:complete